MLYVIHREMEVFKSEDVTKILWKKLVVVIGDSIQRCVYKDFVCLLSPGSNTRYLTGKELKAKGEIEFLNDKLLQGGQLGDVKTGINYREVRQYDAGTSVIKFYFVTRCYSDHLESILNELKTMQPHAIIMNSCLWDLHRYGPNGPDSYHINMKKLMTGLKKAIPSDAIFIWNATLPLDSKCKGGFLLPYFENIPSQEIIEANFVASDIVLSYGYIFLDLHSIFVHQLHHRANDGIHWNHYAHRRISNLILHQLCRAWNMPVPRTMPLNIPRGAHSQPLAERPHNASIGSYTSHLHIDRYGFSSSSDARYVVQKPSSESYPNSYKDRFRLIGSPIITSSLVVGNDNQKSSPLIPDPSSNVKRESGPFPEPIYSSSPIESNCKTKSFLQQNRDTASLGSSSLSEGHLDQNSALSQHLNQDCKNTSLVERNSYKNSASVESKIFTSHFSNESNAKSDRDKESIPTDKALSNAVSQSSTLVVQVSSSRSTDMGNVIEKHVFKSTSSSINPAPPTEGHSSQLTLPVNQVMSSKVTKTTSSMNVQHIVTTYVNKVLPSTSHTSQVSTPVNHVTSVYVTKTTPSIRKLTSVCIVANKALEAPSHVSQLRESSVSKAIQCEPVNQMTSSASNITVREDKENARCTTGNRIPSIVGTSHLRLAGGEIPKRTESREMIKNLTAVTPVTPCSTITKLSTPQQTVATFIQNHPKSLDTKTEKKLDTTNSIEACSTGKLYERLDGELITHPNKSTTSNDVTGPSNLLHESLATWEMKKPALKPLERKSSKDIEPKKRTIPPKSVYVNTCGKSHSEADKKPIEKTSSTMSSKKEASTRGQKRKATGDVNSSRKTKQGKIEESEKEMSAKTEDPRKPSNNLKRKAPVVGTTANTNTSLEYRDLEPPPVKRGKNEQNIQNMSQTYTRMQNNPPVSGQYSTSSSVVSQSSIPVHSGTRIETRNLQAQGQCNQSYNFSPSNCYWMGGQQSLQDIQQQQQWFNTLLSRGRLGAQNNVHPLMYYNQQTRSWHQGYYYNNNFRY